VAVAVSGSRRWTLTELEELGDHQFVLLLEAAYWRLGFVVKRVAGDELILSRDGKTTVVEARREPDEQAIRDTAAAQARHGCDRGVLVTPGHLQRGERRFARALGVHVVERHAVSRLLALALDA
jgi:hypothetical protein